MNWKSQLSLWKDKRVLRRAFFTSIVVGSILTLINHWVEIVTLDFSHFHIITAFLTFLVPFLVASYASIRAKFSFVPGEVSAVDAELMCKECDDVTVQVKQGQVIPECENCPGEKVWVLKPAREKEPGEMKLAEFVKMNPSPVLRLNPEGFIIHANPAFLALDDTFHIGMSISDVFDDFGPTQIQERISQNDVVDLVQRIGTHTYKFEIRGIKAANVCQVYGSDITELEEYKAQLQSLSHFPRLNPSPVLRISKQGTILDSNPAVRDLLHQDPKGWEVTKVIPELESFDFANLIEKSETSVVEHQVGDTIFKCTIRGIPDLGVCQLYGADVTEIINSKKEVESVALFAKLNPEPVMRFDAEGTILLSNPAANQVFEKETVVGENIRDLIKVQRISFEEIIHGNSIEIIDTELREEVFRFIIRGIDHLDVCQCYGSNVTEKVHILQDQEKRIKDSIACARKIQRAAIPSDEFIKKILPDSFVFFEPRDMVSGDFYWIAEKEHRVYFAAVDCTGHGVPGGFMSMLGISLLNEITQSDRFDLAADILTEMRARVKRTLSQMEDESSTEGMDMALCIYDKNTGELQYSGAFNPLVLYKKDETIHIKADRMPVGIYYKEKPTFTNHSVQIDPGDSVYIFSDGFADQFGGDDNKKYRTSRLLEFFKEISVLPPQEQREALETEFHSWRGRNDQIDDVLVMGVRFGDMISQSLN